jgi:DNA repair ATPase RecN
MSNIWQIQQNYLSIINQLIDNGGELTPELETAMAITQEELQHKAHSCVVAIRALEHDVDACANEIKRLQAIKKARENAAERLRKSIETAMTTFDINRIEFATTVISLRKSEAVQISDESTLPEQYLRWKSEPDKTKIKAALKSGEDVIGAQIVENVNLQIK